jgi:hypothetical protein
LLNAHCTTYGNSTFQRLLRRSGRTSGPTSSASQMQGSLACGPAFPIHAHLPVKTSLHGIQHGSIALMSLYMMSLSHASRSVWAQLCFGKASLHLISTSSYAQCLTTRYAPNHSSQNSTILPYNSTKMFGVRVVVPFMVNIFHAQHKALSSSPR